MPFYEMMLTLRPAMQKSEVSDCLRRVANIIWKENGVLRKIEYLGYKKLPFKGRSKEEGLHYTEGSQFLYHISSPQLKVPVIAPELRLDVDLISSYISEANDSILPEGYECTLEEELKPPFYRKSVQPMLEYKNVRANVRRIHKIYE